MDSNLKTLSDIKEWERRLGLFPVPLRGDLDLSIGQFVLLNGTRGNFCLDLENTPSSDSARSLAWSSNVGHYVKIHEEEVEVRRWDLPGSVEKYDCHSIAERLESFHEYLEANSPDSNTSVVTHGIRVFRSLRTALGANFDGNHALKAFLFLLTCAWLDDRRESVNAANWNLDPEAAETALSLNEQDWQALLHELRGGLPLERLSVHVDLLLRHASGILFQEAHFEALLPPVQQMNFGFTVPAPAALSPVATGIGLHFTPPALARTLVEEALAELDLEEQPQISFFDPACGSGEFLREALRQLRLKGYRGLINLRGWDISEAAYAMARFGLAWDLGNSVSVSIKIEQLDSLAPDSNWPENVDVILMNPPFVSWENMTKEWKDSIKRILGSEISKRPDLSAAFLAKASRCLRAGGVLATLLPASFFEASSTSRLRESLGARLSAKLVARLGSHSLFPGAIVDTGMYVAKVEDKSAQEPIALWADYKAASTSAALRALRKLRLLESLPLGPLVQDGYSIYPNPGIGSGPQSWSPRPYKPLELFRKFSGQPRVRDLFDVRQGARTGHNSAFVVSRANWRQLPASEKPFFRPAVVGQSLRNGVLDDSAYVFFPYGEREISGENQLKKQLPVYYKKFLSPHKPALQVRAGSTERWWELTWHRTWQVEPKPKLVSTYFGDAGYFAWDQKGTCVVVQGFGWLPRKPLVRFPRRLALAYLAILNSELFSQLLSATSNNVAGGQWDLSPRFVGEIPIPLLRDYQLIEDLARQGEKIHSGELEEMPKKDYAELVRAAYLSA